MWDLSATHDNRLHTTTGTTPRALHSDRHHPFQLPTTKSKKLPSMDSESEKDHRDDESLSEQEEIEEPKPKSALKKARDVPAPVERPELPYVMLPSCSVGEIS